MVVQIPGFDELNIRICRGNLVGEAVDPVNQNSGKQKIGKHHNALVAQPCDMLETGLNQRKGDARIANLGLAKADTLP